MIDEQVLALLWRGVEDLRTQDGVDHGGAFLADLREEERGDQVVFCTRAFGLDDGASELEFGLIIRDDIR